MELLFRSAGELGPITLFSSDGLSFLEAYYSGDAVIKNDGADVFFLNPVMVSEDDSHVQKSCNPFNFIALILYCPVSFSSIFISPKEL